MADKSDSIYIQRNFGHCLVEWEIENFGYAAHGMKYELKSPSFTVRPTMTSWRMSLSSEQGLYDDVDMMFGLERLDCASIKSAVCVIVDVSLVDQDGGRCNSSRSEYLFKPKDKICLSVTNIYFGLANVSIYNFNSMTLRCQMIICEGKKGLIRGSSVDPGLMDLSKDMEKLFKNSKFTDIILEIGGVTLTKTVHKSILSARTRGLNNSLNGESVSFSNDLTLQFNDTLEVLRYLYTGDVKNILVNPSFSIYDCIYALSLDELKEHYTADNQKLQSKIDIELAGYLWTIEDFMKRKEKCIESPLIFCDFCDAVWQLCLYPEGISGNEEYLAVTAESVEGKIDGKVWAKAEVLYDVYHRSWKTMNVVKEGQLFEIRNLDSRKSVSEKLESGTLRLCFKACASIGETDSSHAQEVCSVPKFPLENYFKKLSDDIFSLRKDPKFSDVVLVTQGVEIKAHKCILSARAAKFSNLSEKPDEDKVINLNNIKPNVLEIVLDYIYSGVYKTFDLDMLLEVYVAARELRVNYLEQEYSKILRSSINDDNIIKILTASGQDHELETQALAYLKSNINSIYDKTVRKVEPENSNVCNGEVLPEINIATEFPPTRET